LPEPYTDGNGNSDTYGNSDCDRNCDTYGYSNCDRYGHGYGYGKPDGNCYANAADYPDSKAASDASAAPDSITVTRTIKAGTRERKLASFLLAVDLMICSGRRVACEPESFAADQAAFWSRQ
jgi:hypothetical protein